MFMKISHWMTVALWTGLLGFIDVTGMPMLLLSCQLILVPVLIDRICCWATKLAGLPPPPVRPSETQFRSGGGVGRGGVGFGAVIRDHRGTFLASSAVPVKGLLSPPVAESLAILHGLILCSRLGFSEVMVETDCQRVFCAATKKTPLLIEFGNVLADIFLLCDWISVSGFHHC